MSGYFFRVIDLVEEINKAASINEVSSTDLTLPPRLLEYSKEAPPCAKI